MAERKVYLNGEFVTEAEARVSIFDSALIFGDMLFEMTRTFNNDPFRLPAHLERLYRGLKVMEIDAGLTIDQMEEATIRTLEANIQCFPDDIDCHIMHNVSRGPLPLYESVFPEGIGPTVTISCWPLTTHLAAHAEIYETGVHAVVTPQRSVPARLIDPKIKNRSRIYYQVANQQAVRVDPDAWALLTDDNGYITEGTGSNFFIVREGELFSAEPHNILRGVTRGALIDLATRLGLKVHTVDIEPYDAMNADEAFFTATSFSIMPCTRFDGRPISDAQPGPITRRLITAWSEWVGVDIVAQAKQYAEDVKAITAVT